MARLPYRQRNELDELGKALWDEIERRRGHVPYLYQALANSPSLMRQFVDMAAVIRGESALPAALKELAILTVARITGAGTMRVAHVPEARAAGLSVDQVEAALKGSGAGLLSDEQLAVMSYAERATVDIRVPDETWEAVAAFLNSEQLTELVLTVGFYNMVARFLAPAQIDLDPRYR
jgi:AhpD family alkylhydroperoxidase